MALDFTTGVLDPRVTVTRALNTATRINSSGFIETVNADLPRFDYDSVTLSPKGLLIEETRINILPNSETFTSGWTPEGASITTENVTSPSNAITSVKIVENSATGAHGYYAGVVVTNSIHSGSIFLKAGERTKASVFLFNVSPVAAYEVKVDLSNGTIIGTPTGTWQITALQNGWYRISIVSTAALLGTARLWVRMLDAAGNASYTGNGASGLYIYGAQLEAGAFATSYIPTTLLAVTRNADVVSMTGTNFSDWYNASEGTFSVNASLMGQKTSFRGILAASDSTSLTYIGILQASNGYSIRGNVIDNNISQAALTLGTSANGANLSASLAYKVDSFAGSLNAANPVTDVSGVVPTVSELNIGYWGAAPPNTCHIKKISYWPQRLTNAEVQAFSK
jgi:hypothetical protein